MSWELGSTCVLPLTDTGLQVQIVSKLLIDQYLTSTVHMDNCIVMYVHVGACCLQRANLTLIGALLATL